MTTKPRLSIGIPSNRPLATSHSAIKSAHDFCTRNGYSLVVSDNSGDAEKATWLRDLMQGPDMKHIDSPPCGMMENWFQTFHATTGNYVLMMGDDDTIFAYETAGPLADIASDVVGIRPAIMGYAENHGILRVNTSGITADHGAKRVMEHLTTSAGSNLGLFTFWRRDIMEPIMNLWFGPHPTKGTYCDWAVMNALCSSGPIIRHTAGTYFYNLQNWMGDAAAIQEQVERAFVKAGLPEGSSNYDRLLNAVDSYIFINRKVSPLSLEERYIAAVMTMNMYIQNQLQKEIVGATPHANAVAIATAMKKLEGLDDVPRVFEILAEVLDAIEPGLAQRYKDFHQAAVGHPWGDFTYLIGNAA